MQLDNEVLDNAAVHSTENNELNTNSSIARHMAELPVEHFNIEEEMAFDDLTIPGDYSDCGILEEEKETVSLNNESLVKTKKGMWKGRVMLIPYSNKKEDCGHL